MTITFKAIPFRAYAPAPSASAIFFKCILEVVFSEDVQNCLRFCLHDLNCGKMAAFQFYLQSEKQRKVGRVGKIVMFCQKFHGEKGSVRRAVVVMLGASSFVAKVRGEVFSYFHEVAVKRHSSMRK
jgi:hypothetical protein